MGKPVRAVIFTAKIEADNRKELSNHLYMLATELERGEFRAGTSVSGGVGSGHIIELIENDGPSHDEWFASLRAYLDGLREAGNG